MTASRSQNQSFFPSGISVGAMNSLTRVIISARRITDHGLLFPAALTLTLVILFHDCVGRDLVFAFRDSAHFYPPLYELVRDEWLSGRVPLWNPLANGGQPLAGSGTAGAFYPPQVLLSILLPAPMAVNLYGISHLALAAAGAYRLARAQRLSRVASSVAGLAYGFSGSLIFQVYNPIFTAGAAWLVWAVVFGWRLIRRGGIRDAVGVAVSLACAVLCGDPQSAFHSGLVLGVVLLFLDRPLVPKASALVFAAILGGLMGLVQILLAGEFIRETDRAMDLAPQSVWQLPEFFSRTGQSAHRANWYDVFIGRPPNAARHYDLTYDFSLPPWRLIELLWPDFAGTLASRWTISSGFETPRIWVSSLYAGTPVFLLSFIAAGRRRSRRWAAVWGLLAVASIWGSLGGYGGIGLVRNAWRLATGSWSEVAYRPGDEVGGLYWVMTTFLPGYHGFRYPSKCLAVFALAMSQLAGLGMDGLRRPRLRAMAGRLSIGVSGGMMLATVAAAVLATWATEGQAFAAGREDYPGSFGIAVMLSGGLQACVVAFLLWVTIRFRTPAAVLVGLVAIDIGLAGRRDLVVGHHENLVESAAYLRSLAADRLSPLAAASPRMRIAEIKGDRPPFRYSSAFPDDHLRYLGLNMVTHAPWLHGQGNVGAFSTATQSDTDLLLTPAFDNDGWVVPRRTYDLYGVEYFVVENSAGVLRNTEALFHDWSADQKAGDFAGMAPLGQAQETLALRLPDDPEEETLVYAIRNESALPRVRVVHDAVIVPAVSRSNWDHWIDLLKRIAFPNPELPDLTRVVVLEQGSQLDQPERSATAGATIGGDACAIVVDEPQRVVIEAELMKPGFVILADTFHKDWQLVVHSVGAAPREWPILRANRVHRACHLPAGRHVLEFRHHSATFEWSALVTMLAWGLGGVLLIAGDRAKRPVDAMKAVLRKRFSMIMRG